MERLVPFLNSPQPLACVLSQFTGSLNDVILDDIVDGSLDCRTHQRMILIGYNVLSRNVHPEPPSIWTSLVNTVFRT
jgi:hypothetical protein